MKIIDHGTWVQYTPSKFPPGFPDNVLFCRREKDKVDWYEFQKSVKEGSIWALCTFQMDRWLLSAVVRDISTLFPNFPTGVRVLEITDSHLSPQELRLRVYDPSKNALGEPIDLTPKANQFDARN